MYTVLVEKQNKTNKSNTRGTSNMSRERMVTRTIEITEVLAMVCDTEKATVSNEYFTIMGKEADIMKRLKLELPEHMTVVKILSSNIKEQVYAMTEQEFITYAKPYDR